MPARVNVCEALAPRLSVPVSNDPSRAVAVWDEGPVFVHMTVSPTWTVTDAGPNAKSLMPIEAAAAARATSRAR